MRSNVGGPEFCGVPGDSNLPLMSSWNIRTQLGYRYQKTWDRSRGCHGQPVSVFPIRKSPSLACQPVHYPVDGQHGERLLNSSPRAPLENNGCISQVGWLGQSKADVSGLSTVENILWLRSDIALMAWHYGCGSEDC